MRFFARAACSASAAFSSLPCATAYEYRAAAGETSAPGPCVSGWPSPPRSRRASVMRSAVDGSTSATSTVPSVRAFVRSFGATARKTRVSSLALSPHQRGLRARVTVPSALLTPRSTNGPAVFLRVVRAPSLKVSGEPVISFGYSGENSERQSPYGLEKVTRTWRSSAPRSIFSIRS